MPSIGKLFVALNKHSDPNGPTLLLGPVLTSSDGLQLVNLFNYPTSPVIPFTEAHQEMHQFRENSAT